MLNLKQLMSGSLMALLSISAVADEHRLTVYKSPTCGCCEAWIDHVKAAGYSVSAQHPQDLNAVKQHFGVQPNFRSCHTAVSEDRFVFEGHVPAKFVEAFLSSPPEGAIGLSVPAMPVGTPGMEMGDKFMPYKVVLLKADGSGSVFAEVNQAADQF